MKIVTGQEMKSLDKKAVEEYGISNLLLMEHAAKSVADTVMAVAAEHEWSKAVVLCGGGNNGGDGFGAARWLQQYGMKVRALLIGTRESELQGSAAVQLSMFLKAGGELHTVLEKEDVQLAEIACLKADVLVDAVIGTGFHGELKGAVQEVCRIVNATGKYVVAVDVPTGINADDGMSADDAVKADCTVTMGMLKTGLLLYPAKNYVGQIVVADIGMPEKLLDGCESKKYLLTPAIVKKLLPLRSANAHKGDAGKIVLAAGSPAYTGAAALAAAAAVKAGGGLVSLLTPLSCRDILSIKLTEVMVHGLLERMPGVLGGGAAVDILNKADAADVLAIGPGLGTSENTFEVVREVIRKSTVPVVIDADALSAMKEHTDLLKEMTVPKVLTPHPGEMARLTGMTAEQVDRERVEIAAAYAREWNAVIVLKGAPTVIGCPDGTVYINTTGCNAMATGGSGDVLTGIIAALAGQNISLQEAAVCGVYLHGMAGEMAADGRIGLAAGEISTSLPQARKLVEMAAPADEPIYNNALNVIK